jgi:Uncharacterized conserved protein
MNINRLFKKIMQNFAILLLFFIAIKNLFAALPLPFAEKYIHFYDRIINPHTLALHHVLSFLLGCIMLLLLYRLYKRVRFAWMIEIIMLTVSFTLQVVRYHTFTFPIAFIELFVLAVLIWYQKDFSRKTDRITVIKAFGFILVSMLLVLANASIGMLIMKTHFNHIDDITDAIENSAKLLFFMDTSTLEISGRIGKLYADSLIIINWFSIVFSVFLLLKPLVYNPIVSIHDKEKAHRLVLQSGQNPMSFLTLESDKKYLFGISVEGICAYQIVGNVMVVCGDMICEEKDGFAFLNEILSFCNHNDYSILFLNITEAFIPLYQMAGFGRIKYGEDACFKLSDYNLVGGKVAKVRAAINHANNAGITVKEYKPTEEKDSMIELEMAEISKEWLTAKGGEEMGFMLGGTGLENPLERRYFYALDAENNMLGFAVFLPYLQGKGYLADVTRRRNNAPQGVLEKIIYDAFQQLKTEGAIWGNLGLSPLYHVAEGDKTTITERLFNYIYENMNRIYDFKSLHHAKEKYAPTEWQPRYLAYYPRPFSPNAAFAIVRVQLGKGFAKTMLSELGWRKEN